jgi:hypothetical protein
MPAALRTFSGVVIATTVRFSFRAIEGLSIFELSSAKKLRILRIRVHGEKVFEIRWDKAGGFKVVHYDQGDWERTLRTWPEPIPFD